MPYCHGVNKICDRSKSKEVKSCIVNVRMHMDKGICNIFLQNKRLTNAYKLHNPQLNFVS